ncbi:MAG: hypothetical protein SGPRY_001862 [Prymnesium sp.]
MVRPSSSSICELINGEFEFVKDKRRNRLTHTKAEKLVGLFHNIRLLHRMKKPMYTEPAIGWNEEDAKTGLVKFGLNHYELLSTKAVQPPTRPAITFEDGDWVEPELITSSAELPLLLQ